MENQKHNKWIAKEVLTLMYRYIRVLDLNNYQIKDEMEESVRDSNLHEKKAYQNKLIKVEETNKQIINLMPIYLGQQQSW